MSDSAAKTQCNTSDAPARVWRVESAARLEIFLLQRIPNASRESIRRALAAGACRVDSIVRPKGFRLSPGSLVTLDAAARISVVLPESIPLDILYEDQELIAVNKPAGMLVHPTGVERSGTVANSLCGMGYPGIHFLHRLDRGTSGVLLAAKTLAPRSPLARMFAARLVEKIYLALVRGPVAWDEQTVALPIGRDPSRLPQWNVSMDGASAETRFRVLARHPGQVLLEAQPITGRTNQIRIHSAASGHPLLGDVAYGGSPSSRLMLHALSLTFPAAARSVRVVTAPPPSAFSSPACCAPLIMSP